MPSAAPAIPPIGSAEQDRAASPPAARSNHIATWINEMTQVEETVAWANAYSQAEDTLRLEKLILTAMSPREPETRSHVMAQIGRVAALERVLAALAVHQRGEPGR